MRALIWIVVGAVLAALGYGAWVVKSKYDAHMQTLHGCESERNDVKSKLAEHEAKLAQSARERADTEKVATDAQNDLTATRTELDELRRQRTDAEQRLAAFNELTSKLQKMIDTGKLKVLVRGGRFIVKLPAEVLFESGKADLNTDGKLPLGEVAKALRELPDRRFMVAGHTDNLPVGEGKYRNNWDLSTARAVTVTEFLMANGLRPKSLVAAGYAEHDPVAPNATPAGRQENRRIEIVLLPNVEELPKLLDKTRGADAAGATTPAATAAPQAAPVR